GDRVAHRLEDAQRKRLVGLPRALTADQGSHSLTHHRGRVRHHADDSRAGAENPAYAFAGNSGCDRNEKMAFRVWFQGGADFAQHLIYDLWLYRNQDCPRLADDEQVIGGGFDLEPALEGAAPGRRDIRDDQITGAEYPVLEQSVRER